MYLPGEITRAGKNTKIILLGDPDQIDKPFLDERTNVLSYAAKHMQGSPLCWQISMSADECVRSELAQDAIMRIVIFDKRLIEAGTDEFLSVPAICLKNKRCAYFYRINVLA